MGIQIRWNSDFLPDLDPCFGSRTDHMEVSALNEAENYSFFTSFIATTFELTIKREGGQIRLKKWTEISNDKVRKKSPPIG
jgi:hypothetical protein